MIKRILLLLLAVLWLTPANAQSVNKLCFPTGTASGGNNSCQDVTTTNPLPTTATLSATGGLNVTVTNTIAGPVLVSNPNGFGGTITGTLTVQNQSAGSNLNVLDTNSAAILAAVQGAVPTGSNLIGSVTAVGPNADAITASNNPVALGAIYQTTQPTYTDGQRTSLRTDTRGNLQTTIVGANGIVGTNGVSVRSPQDGATNGQASLNVNTYVQKYNGSTWDREFTCPNMAPINVTAANTAQIVALSGTTVTRVCSITVSMSAAGTFQILSGTGANCGTPANAMTAMTLATGTPLAQSAPAGGSLFRSTAGGEVCIAATTGNVTGWLTYVQY